MISPRLCILALLAATPICTAALPAPATSWFDFPLSYAPEAPGVFSADGLIDKPAGAHGTIVARHGHFFTTSPERRIRFLGVNLCYGASFPTHDQADELARRLSRYGINIIRFHHMDAQPFPNGLFADRTLTTLDPRALDRLDYLIAAFKSNGIYADLNLHVSRSDARAHHMPNADQAPSMDKQIDLFDPTLIDSQRTYARDLLTHVNAYTHKSYAEEPAVAMIEINNENTLFMWGAEQNLQSLPDPFAEELRTSWNDWLQKKYGSREALADAWARGVLPGSSPPLAADEAPADHSVRMKSRNTSMAAARAHDWYDFLQSVDQAYFDSMYDFLKKDLHVAAPVTGTIGLGALGTLTQTRTDFIDAHQYWEHPVFPHSAWSTTDYRIGNSPMVDSATRGILPALAAIRVADMPFTVTEYDHPAPSDWRAEALPLLATTAALQDWDAVFIFAYSHGAKFRRDHTDSFFDLAADPAQLNLMPVAARLFLGGAIHPLPPAAPVSISRDEALDHAGKYYFNLAAELKDLHGITPDALMRRQISIRFEPAPSLPEASTAGALPSWTTHGPGTGQFIFSDACAAEFIGFPKPGETVRLGPITLRDITSPFFVATLTAANPTEEIAHARELLLTITGRTENHDMGWNATHNSVSDQWGTGPVQLETLAARIDLPSGCTLIPLDSAGQPTARVSTGSVDLSTMKTSWFRIDRSAP